jgi:8-oxo-dGTP pyrophosphatase MutT (NUDIX family)
MIRGAGIMFITPDSRVLFLKRGPGGDWPSHYCFPGGTTEEGESAEQTAIRESIEELGRMPDYLKKGPLIKHAVTVMPTAAKASEEAPSIVPPQPDGALPPDRVEYTTFIQRVEDIFEPQINGEHTGFAWAPANDPPLPIHPGCQTALDKLNWHELDVAKAIRDGRLASPQQFENMWLFAMRISGTGIAYRKKLNEYVYRRPEDYLSPEFLERCSALSIIVQHPKGGKLDSQEFSDRIVGVGMLVPWVKQDEVWGIAKIYDAETAEMLSKNQLSTSPAVVLFTGGDNIRMKTEDGKSFLVEGSPKLLDHLAICTIGVWDKGKLPSGIAVEAIGDDQMAEEKKEEKKDAAKADEHIEPAKQSSGGESGGHALDKMLSKLDDCMKKMDSVSSRMDAMEEEKKKDKADAAKADAAKKDSEKEEKKEEEKKDAASEEAGKAKEVVADKKRKDAEEDEKKKMDAKADSNESLQRAIDELKKQFPTFEARLPKVISDEERNLLSDAQARADNVCAQFGERAPHPLPGESHKDYRRRVALKLKPHSPTWKGVNLEAIADDAAFDVAERQIYADAATAAQAPEAVPEGTLRGVTQTLGNGSKLTRFIGHPSAWMNDFIPTRRALTRLDPKANQRI